MATTDVARPKLEGQRGDRARTSGGNNNDDDAQGSDLPSWMFKEESNKDETNKVAVKKEDSNKKPSQPKKNGYPARQDVRIQEVATKEKCVAVPVLTRAQVKKSDIIHPLKVKEAMSSVDKSTIANLQKKDFTLKKCFDRVGNRSSERTMFESSS